MCLAHTTYAPSATSASTSGRMEAMRSEVLFAGLQPIESDLWATHRALQPKNADLKGKGRSVSFLLTLDINL